MGNSIDRSSTDHGYQPTEEEIQEAKEIMKLTNQSQIQSLLKEKAYEWKKEKLLCGIIGNTGTGKSSLINAIRGLKPTDKGAAAVKSIESTLEVKRYPDPDNKNFVYCDLPGVGTSKFPKATYLQQIGFEKYDFFFIVSSCRFTENDIWLAKQIRDKRKKFYFIRTKIDEDIVNEKRDYGKSKETVLEHVYSHTKKSLESEGFANPKVYLICNHETKLYHFSKLVEDVMEDLPVHKKEAMCLSIKCFSETLIKEKKKALKKYVYLFSLGSAIGAVVPIPFVSLAVDMSIIMVEVEHYKCQFGLTDRDLQKSGLPQEKISYFQQLYTKEAVGKLFAFYGASTATEEVSRIVIPVVGSFISSGISFATTFRMLNGILDKMADTALEVLKTKMKDMVNK